MLCNLSVNCDPPDTTRYDGKNTAVKRLACARGSSLIGCAPISQLPSQNFKGKYKKNQSHKISGKKIFVLIFTKIVRLFKHHDLLARVRNLGSDSQKTRYLLITAIAYAQTFDSCVDRAVCVIPRYVG